MKRILFCSAITPDPRLGMGKHWLDLADSFRGLGWEAHVVGPDEMAGDGTRLAAGGPSHRLRDFLRRTSVDFDVVEYDHAYLPFPRSDFPAGPLFVARCMLLHHHFLTTPIPSVPRLLSRLRHALNTGRRRRRLERVVAETDATVQHADLTVVSNDRDAAALVSNGANPDRIAVFPLGLSQERLRRFAEVPDAIPDSPVVGFVGTFDPRKGMCEFPALVDQVARLVPEVTFRLLGTAGMVPDAAGVQRYFPRRLWSRLEIYPRYDPNELPGLLAGVSVGVFPSRVESFGYGVLEMLAAAVPVIAYDAPGPHAILSPEYQVPVGAVRELAGRVGDLLANRDRLQAARLSARTRAADFRWEEIAARTAAVYTRRLAALRGTVV